MENTKTMRRRHLVGAVLLATSSIFSAPAQADTWACEIALCLANPKGPTAAAACVGPIKRLWRHLALGHAMPTCPFLKNNGTQAETRTEKASGQNCPAGQTYLGGQGGRELMCTMQGAVTTYQNGEPQKRMWWNEQGETITELFAPAANAGDALQQLAPSANLE
jgi:hypothetical protein